MANARFAAIALAIYSCITLAQNHAQATFTTTVTDQTGARVPGARITVTDEATGSRTASPTDSTGQATFQLNEGTYQLRVQAKGFESYEEKEIEVKAAIKKNVTLQIGRSFSPIVVSDAPEILLDHPVLAIEIPIIPTSQFSPPNRTLRRRSRWL